jgi:hypothetical protein
MDVNKLLTNSVDGAFNLLLARYLVCELRKINLKINNNL